MDKWTMPEWMRAFLRFLFGNLNDDVELQVDPAVGLVEAAHNGPKHPEVRERVALLERLHDAGLLPTWRDEPPRADELPALFLVRGPGIPEFEMIGCSVLLCWQESEIVSRNSTPGIPPGAIVGAHPTLGRSVAVLLRRIRGAKWCKIPIPALPTAPAPKLEA